MNPNATESRRRFLDHFASMLGREMSSYLSDPEVVDVMLNPDGHIWLDRLGKGMERTPTHLTPEAGVSIIRMLAAHLGKNCMETPIIDGELPGTGARFHGTMPCCNAERRPTISIRLKAAKIFRLEEYVARGIMSEEQRLAILEAIKGRKNILVAGGTGSGKTTLVNGILHEVGQYGHRVLILEDTVELQCGGHVVQLRTVDGQVDLNDLVKSAMRMRPDRIVVGEVRGKEALDLLKAWNTGHPGGVGTIHADGPVDALYRVEMLAAEANANVPRILIARAVNLVVFIARQGTTRRVQAVKSVSPNLDERQQYVLQEIKRTASPT